jgi:hypothetical protein
MVCADDNSIISNIFMYRAATVIAANSGDSVVFHTGTGAGGGFMVSVFV